MEQSTSLLDQPVTLGDIIDPDSLQRVCMTFARLYQTGIAVLDNRGEVLVDIPAEHPLCRRISAHPHGAGLSCSFDNLVKGGRGVGDEAVAAHCLCGLRYEMLGILHQGELLGRVVYGPYRPDGLSELPAALTNALGGDPAEQRQLFDAAGSDLQRMATMSSERARSVTSAINEVLTVIVQTGYARHLTSQIHIAAIQDAYNELTEKNRRLADSVEKLKELDKLKSSFLATVSHELRTPLTSVIGYSEMLLEGLAGELNGEQRDYLQTIMDKGDHLLQIINEILDISKIEGGNVQLSCESFAILDLLREVYDAMVPQARTKGLRLEFDVADGLPKIEADRSKMRQILLNLVSNAVKFTPKGGEVRAVVRQDPLPRDGGSIDGLRIEVHDSGIGVPADARGKIFEAFYQADGSSTREYGGTGLGLSIVKHLTEAHGGQVWVEAPRRGQGSVFIIHLPLCPPSGPRAKAGIAKRLDRVVDLPG